ncbi:MAG: radical SAM family heme chaperone HemW, partial [Candidatus Omnitrophica bacterium]|nr:radical SAM family heme chaperone HemW [Candidatus Omnitrophota bacterium]
MIGLYVHIPFCLRRCHYCDFVIAGAGSPAKREAFFTAFEKEAARASDLLQGVSFDTVYVGGGTPSVLSLEETSKLFDLLKKYFRWEAQAEVTYEANPGDADEEKAKAYRGLGVNRISLGAQSFNDPTLKRLNRTHDAAAIFSSYGIFRKAGFDNVSLDLMLALPGETLKEAERSVAQAVGLGPEHVSLYELTVEPSTVFGRRRREGTLGLPAEDAQAEMLSCARDRLKTGGFRHYELLSHAKPGFESRHNGIYWANEEYLGLGPGAFSHLKGKRFRYASSYAKYLDKANRNDWVPEEEETLEGERKEVESLLLALRLTEGASMERFRP